MPVAQTIVGVPGGDVAYMNSAFFHHLVAAVDAAERRGRPGVEAVGAILVALSQTHDAVMEEAIARLMQASPGPIRCGGIL